MIKAIITDFDGTLVDTFEANLRAYQDAFHTVGKTLTTEKYRECFGYRYDRFMMTMGINDDLTIQTIKELKKKIYPKYFLHLRPNKKLIELITTFHHIGVKTAIASTARKENLMNAINYLGIEDLFDMIYVGNDVKRGKPSPEIYLKTMNALGVTPDEVMIFEDSSVGLQAAEASGANYIPVTPQWFGNKELQ